jgi:hypothetical protein
MKLALSLWTAVALSAPSIALACPYGAASSGCHACGGSLFEYAASLVAGLVLGFASVRRR